MLERERLDAIVRHAFDLNRRYYEGLFQLSVDYVTGISKAVLGTGFLQPLREGAMQGGGSRPVSQPSPAAATTIVLEAEAGKTAHGFFLVQNALRREVTARPRAENCVDAEGNPGSIGITFSPSEIRLAPGEQMTVQVVAEIDEGVEPGVPYRTKLTVPGLADAGIPTVVRRRHSISPEPPGPKSAGGAEARSDPKPRSAKKPARSRAKDRS